MPTASPILLPHFHLTLPPAPPAVRSALKCILGAISGLAISPDDRDAFQSALAEILNNVVEHAHCDCPDGTIEVWLQHDPKALVVTVLDDGTEMPGGTLPPGRDDWDTSTAHSLPEGGFGWFMIRQLVDNLTYTRDGGINRMTFRMRLGTRD